MPWEPIKPLSDSDLRIYVGDADAFRRSFDAAKSEALAHHIDIATLLDRYRREWAIETGILERLYDIDRGTTNLLIERGFVADVIARNAGQGDPTDLIAVLNDHDDAIQIVYEWVSGMRPFTLSAVKELHQVLTRNQEWLTGIDSARHLVRRPLTRGEWKKLPNNPSRPDGQLLHEYCPPIHVQSEMERLKQLLDTYQDVHPLVASAWLHHRFTQIHPFEDGNGRVARSLMNYALIRGGFIPAVVDRDDRTRYLDSLEQADAGRLEPLVRMLADVMTHRMKRLLAEIRQGPARGDGRTPLTAEEAADRLALRLRLRVPQGGSEPGTTLAWRTAVLGELGSAVKAAVDVANARFKAAGFKPRLAAKCVKESWFVWFHPEPSALQITPGPLVDELMVVVAAVTRRDRGDAHVERAADRELLLAAAEPIAEVTRRIRPFVDQWLGAWLSTIE